MQTDGIHLRTECSFSAHDAEAAWTIAMEVGRCLAQRVLAGLMVQWQGLILPTTDQTLKSRSSTTVRSV